MLSASKVRPSLKETCGESTKDNHQIDCLLTPTKIYGPQPTLIVFQGKYTHVSTKIHRNTDATLQ